MKTKIVVLLTIATTVYNNLRYAYTSVFLTTWLCISAC